MTIDRNGSVAGALQWLGLGIFLLTTVACARQPSEPADDVHVAVDHVRNDTGAGVAVSFSVTNRGSSAVYLAPGPRV